MSRVYVIDKDDRLCYITNELNVVDCNMPVGAKSVHGNRRLTLVLDFEGNVWRCDLVPNADESPTFEFTQMKNLHNITKIRFDSALYHHYLIDESSRVYVGCSIQEYLKEVGPWYYSSNPVGWLMRLFDNRPRLSVDEILPVRELTLPIVDDKTVTIKKLIYHYDTYFLLDTDRRLWTKPQCPYGTFSVHKTEIEDIIGAPGTKFSGVWLLQMESSVLSFTYHNGISHNLFNARDPDDIDDIDSDGLSPLIYFDRDTRVLYEISAQKIVNNPVMNIANSISGSSSVISPEDIFDIQRYGRFTVVSLQDGRVFIQSFPDGYFYLLPEHGIKKLSNSSSTESAISRTKNARSS